MKTFFIMDSKAVKTSHILWPPDVCLTTNNSRDQNTDFSRNTVVLHRQGYNFQQPNSKPFSHLLPQKPSPPHSNAILSPDYPTVSQGVHLSQLPSAFILL